MALNYNSADGSGNPYYSTSGIIEASDYNSIVDFYAGKLPNFNHYKISQGDIIYAYQINDLLNYIRTYSPSYTFTSLSGNVASGQAIYPLYFGQPVKTQRSMSWGNSSSFYVPGGCFSILVNVLLAGGGGGGTATNVQNGGTGGSGGSGGYIQNQTIDVTPGQTIYINIGSGGLGSHYILTNGFYDNSWGDSGGDSNIQLNGNTLISVGGGGGGGSGGPYSGGAAGGAGSPNGTAGTAGEEGGNHHSHTSSGNGPAGANSPWGTGGSGGVVSGDSNPAQYGGNATGYGAGGGGGAVWDGSGGQITWGGGNGSGGYCQITYPA